jgi:hypothetical protein
MSIETARSFFLWCGIFNYGLLLLWFLLFTLAHDGLIRQWSRWFRSSDVPFDAMNFAGMMLYKLGILLFNLVPWVVLSILK